MELKIASAKTESNMRTNTAANASVIANATMKPKASATADTKVDATAAEMTAETRADTSANVTANAITNATANAKGDMKVIAASGIKGRRLKNVHMGLGTSQFRELDQEAYSFLFKTTKIKRERTLAQRKTDDYSQFSFIWTNFLR